MGKFDGILLCTDLDGTLLTDDKRISPKNVAALEYFKREGGLFAFATGRVPLGASPLLSYIVPNAPSICFNGGAVYDFSARKILWSRTLDSGAREVVEFVDKGFPSAGIEVCTADKVYFYKENFRTREHRKMEGFPENHADYQNIKEEWCKVLFMVEEEEIPALRQLLDNSSFAQKYSFVRSSPWYYELLPRNCTKGEGLTRLENLLGIQHNRVIAMGDNENDLGMIRAAGIGIAVANAVDKVKNAASYITVDNNSDAAAAVIAAIESGELKI